MRLAARLLLACFFLSLAPLPASAACLERVVAAEAGGEPARMTVFVPDDEAALLAAKGFAPAACPADGTIGARYRDAICRVAADGNDAVQARLATVLGEAPARLCAAARRLEPTRDMSVPGAPDTSDPPGPVPGDPPHASP